VTTLAWFMLPKHLVPYYIYHITGSQEQAAIWVSNLRCLGVPTKERPECHILSEVNVEGVVPGT
jgi:hypothetical protein